MKTSDFSWPL